jgi:hypothetical protein
VVRALHESVLSITKLYSGDSIPIYIILLPPYYSHSTILLSLVFTTFPDFLKMSLLFLCLYSR